jgi:hypothetical protein
MLSYVRAAVLNNSSNSVEASESNRKMGRNTQIIIKPDWKKERK